MRLVEPLIGLDVDRGGVLLTGANRKGKGVCGVVLTWCNAG